jgi:transcription termination factor Rho
VATKADLESKSLAELHALAAQASVPRYRMLRREQLVDELLGSGDGGGKPGAESPEEKRPRRRRRGRRRGGAPAAAEREKEEGGEEAGSGAAAGEAATPPDSEAGEAVEISGVLDVVPAGHGFLRMGGLEPQDGDVYISASQIRRCELRPGDTVAGPARPPRRGERHHALVRVESVNGAEPGADRPGAFERLTPVAPHRRIALAPPSDDLTARAAELVVPLGYGQRVLVRAAPRSGRTTLLRSLVRAIAGAPDPPGVIVLLVDERPEEVTEWRRQAPEAEIAAAPADLDAPDQVRHAELGLATAKRRAESGEDVVLVIDSLTRLAVAYGDPAAAKPVFGAGRELEEEGSGSLTVIGTVLSGTDDGGGAIKALETTQNATIALDPELVAAGVFPPIDLKRSEVTGEEALRDPEELERARALRSELAAAEPAGAIEQLTERLRSSSSNAELLGSG